MPKAWSAMSAKKSTMGRLKVWITHLHITLEQRAEPLRTHVLEHFCRVITDRQLCYPGTKLKLVFEVVKQPAN